MSRKWGGGNWGSGRSGRSPRPAAADSGSGDVDPRSFPKLPGQCFLLYQVPFSFNCGYCTPGDQRQAWAEGFEIAADVDHACPVFPTREDLEKENLRQAAS